MAMKLCSVLAGVTVRTARNHTQTKIDEPAVCIGKLTVIHAPVFGICKFCPSGRAEHLVSNDYSIAAADAYYPDSRYYPAGSNRRYSI
jgi:hypothetical protein